MRRQDEASRGLRVSAFLANGMLTRHWREERALREGAEALRRVGVSKVYLDASRGTHPQPEVLARAHDLFRECGLQVSGGLTPVRGAQFGEASSSKWWWLCYTSPATARDVENAARAAARLFDEILVDDFLATDCRCGRCKTAKGDGDWGGFRQRLLVDFASKHIVEPARAENPRVKVIIKYPQWYERFHWHGYDVGEQPRNFDGVWVGTETRDIEYEYVEPYQAFANYRWLASIAGDKVGGGWFDQIECYPEVYLEQAYQTVLAGAPEIVLFVPTPGYLAPDNSMIEAFRRELPRLQRLARVLRGRPHEGVVAYKPRGSDPADEAYLFDVLGALGVPLVPSADLPEGTACAVLGVHAAADAEVVERVGQLTASGSTVLLTAGFLARCERQDEMLALAGHSDAPQPICEWCFEFEAGGKRCKASAHVPFRWALRPGQAKVLAQARGGGGWFPILTEKGHASGGRVLVLAARGAQYPSDPQEGAPPLVVPEPLAFVRLARPVVEILRGKLLEPLDMSFSAPNRVGLYPYAGGVWAVANFGWREAVLEAADKRWSGRAVRERLRGIEVQQEQGTWRVLVPPRTTILLAPEGEETG